MTIGVAFSSVGRRVELLEQFRQEVFGRGGGRLIALDLDRWASATYFADQFVAVPPCSEPGFADAVLAICVDLGISLVVPLIDTELLTYARARREFSEAGVVVNVSGPESIRICHDKQLFHLTMEAAGVPSPEHVLDPDRLPKVQWESGVVVKPRHGSSSIGLMLLDGGHEYELGRVGLEEHVVQRRVRGPEFSVDLFADQTGRARSAFVRHQVEFRAGETSKGESVVNDRVMEVAIAAVEALPDPFGVLHADVIVDEDDGTPYVLELNARFPGGFPLSHVAGSPAIPWLLDLADGVSPDYDAPQPMRDVRMSRYEKGAYFDKSGRLLE